MAGPNNQLVISNQMSKDLWAGFDDGVKKIYLCHAAESLKNGIDLDQSMEEARTIFVLEGEMKLNFDEAYTQLFTRLTKLKQLSPEGF
jgi:hypothetical protein